MTVLPKTAVTLSADSQIAALSIVAGAQPGSFLPDRRHQLRARVHIWMGSVLGERGAALHPDPACHLDRVSAQPPACLSACAQVESSAWSSPLADALVYHSLGWHIIGAVLLSTAEVAHCGLALARADQCPALDGRSLACFPTSRLICHFRNHERDWPGTLDRTVLADSTDSGGECGVIYDKRMGLGMPIIKGAPASPMLCTHPSLFLTP